MCNRPIGWRVDKNVPGGNGGSHNLVPVMCDDYIQALEEALIATSGKASRPDSYAVDAIRKSLNLPAFPLRVGK